ncbi:MAG TPA: alkaline phosphatase [Vicinamibacterales bacterium]|nr:alkaline phosphatase [Vicinamibacterales bacterium]
MRTVSLIATGVALMVIVARVDDGDRTDRVRQSIVGGTARNVLLFIGDGMGDSEITLARNYEVGANGRLALDSLPLTGAARQVPRGRVAYGSGTSPVRIADVTAPV